MILKWAAAGAAALSLASYPCHALEKQATTPSGRAEMVFAHTSLADAVNAVQSECMDKGWMVISQTNSQVVCEVPMGVWQSAFTQLLIGNQYSSPPKQFARFSLAEVGGHSRAQTQVWAETQMAFGQMQHHQYTDDNTYNNMLGFLGEAGAQFPVGTRFEATTYLGIDGEDASWQNGRRSQYGHRLTRVVDGAPAHRMGAQVGDIVTELNNRAIRNSEGFGQALERHRVGRPITLTVMRDGQEVELSGVAEGRPTITTLVHPNDVPEGQTGAAMQVAVAHAGSIEAVYALNPAWTRRPVRAAAAGAAAETEIARARREAAEAQARLAAMEAAATKPEETKGSD